MSVKTPVFLWLFFSGLLFQALAQRPDINFTALTTKDGLSSNIVNAILKDRYGLLWFGTEDGLNKFDGVNFTVYRQKAGDSTSLQANEILSVFEDKKGNLWIGTSGGSLSLYNREKDAFTTFPSNDLPGTISNNVIRSVYGDHAGKIWIAHYAGVNILDPTTRQVSRMPVISGGQTSYFSKECICIFTGSRNQVWIGTNEGLFQYNPVTKSLKQYVHSDADDASLSGNHVNTITEDKRGNLWIGTDSGLSLLQPGKGHFINYRLSKAGTSGQGNEFINSIAVDGAQLWLGTSQGLVVFNTQSGETFRYQQDYRNVHSLTAKAIRAVFPDNQGIYWLGTIGGGVNTYDTNLNLFNRVQSNVFDPRGLDASIVTDFAEHQNGNVYVATDGGGLSLFNRTTGLFQPVPLQSRRTGSNNGLAVLSLKLTRRNQLMVGTFADGLFVVDPASGQYRQMLQGAAADALNANDIYSITEDRAGNLWLGTNGAGINVLNRDNKVVARYTPQPKAANDRLLPINGYIRDIEEASDSRMWIATHGGGVAVLQPTTGRFTIYNTINSRLPNDKVLAILEDSRGNVWIGSRGGLSLFQKNKNDFVTFSEKDGLQNSTIYEILEDSSGVIWVSTNQGISSFDPATKKIANYNYHNGVQNSNFVRGAGLRLSNGDLFFGGLEGFNYFNPANRKKNNIVPPLLITDLRISNQSVVPSEDGPITKQISVADVINLDYKQNFALHYVSLSYTSPEQNQYAYKLEGFDRDWNYVGNSTMAAYTNLDPGEYTFRVKASNNDGVWNEEGTSIKIYVHPPFWRTVYAFLLYGLVILGTLLYIRHRGLQRLKRKFALEQEKAQVEQERKEVERIRELDRLKIKFLTNLSHEFRTPISLILGPADKLLTQEKNPGVSANLSLIKRNARRLLNLVNQLLDFRKMEEHELTLQETNGELVSFVTEVSDSFRDLAERKKIDFVFESGIPQLHTRFDHDKIERILFNLLSNAFKFTLEGGQIRVELNEQENIAGDASKKWVSIEVSDTGIGIPAVDKEKIFDHFFQHKTAASILNQGTGIGLSITKEFVRLQGGTIAVESEPGNGTTFTIHLPFAPVEVAAISDVPLPVSAAQDIEPTPAEEVEEETMEAVLPAGNADKPTVLLVEDNDDFRFYLKDNLRLQYKVFDAANGKEGWQKALAHHPQLVVSDINMPYMDGIELTKKLKGDKRTGHIPVILLTALTAEEDQLKGLGTGANDYITKPFNFEVLNAKIKNLLHLNTTLKTAYSKQINLLAPEVKIESADEKLLHDIMQYIEENLTDTQLSVENLSRHVGMSRSSLYSKLLQLTGQTPVEFIRSIKLDKAAVLLEKSDMNIAQVAYSVGFSTPNYFAKAFKTKFGMLPSEYLTKTRKETEQKKVEK